MTHQQQTMKTNQSPPENYQQYFVPVIGKPVAEDLLTKAKLQEGEKVLDVACGTGIIARLAREEVGPKSDVEALDINPDMIKVAKSVTPSKKNIKWHVASAESIPIKNNSFDVVMCQMGLQFMDDKETALKEMHRVMNAAGRMLLSVPGPEAPLFKILDDALEKHIGTEAAMMLKKIFSLYDSEEIKNLMIRSGFHDIKVTQEKRQMSLPIPKEFFWQYLNSTPISMIVSQADEKNQNNLKEEVVNKWQQFVNNGGMRYEQQITVVTAKK